MKVINSLIWANKINTFEGILNTKVRMKVINSIHNNTKVTLIMKRKLTSVPHVAPDQFKVIVALPKQ